MRQSRRSDIIEVLAWLMILGLVLWGSAYLLQKWKDEPKPTLKYKVGDVIYLKPDSLRVVVTGSLPNIQQYHVEYTDNLGKRQLEVVGPSSVY
jgi:hypothetical protein